MMFVDKAQVTFKAGDGGSGVVSFRHEKFVDKGGPDGGDGGDGGDVVLQASNNENTLAEFRYQRLLKATPGQSGGKRKKHGKSGQDLVVPVPVGTVVTNQDGVVLADLVQDGQQELIAAGGKGGFGNAHFTSSKRQTPRVAEKGEPGEELQVSLELKMIADVGLVGLPNAGKSTLLASISNAHPDIANYPFTTLRPNLGVVDIDKKSSLLFADIPGLIEGASEGKGLGDEFLRHVERTLVLVHMIDIYQEDLITTYKTVRSELEAYKLDIASKPQIVVLNKIDGLDDDMITDRSDELRVALPKNTQIFAISAQSKKGVNDLLYAVQKVVIAQRKKIAAQHEQEEPEAGVPVLRLADTAESWLVQPTEEGGFMVTGRKIERFAAKTDFGNYHAVQRLRDIMKKMGIAHELERQGAQPEDNIWFGKYGKIKL
ncbi:MAG: GTPase ObgE [Candidatus Saccharibacteria bacterium]|nr:GTPase ObgE [Candidatus Saccharibacteria bacterium]